MRWMVVLGMMLMAGETVDAQEEQVIPAGVKVERDLVYGTVGGRELTLDLYWHPEADEAEPLVVFVHGGAWRGGNKGRIRDRLIAVEHGYAVASVGYRLSKEAVFPAQIEDCKAAVRWLRANAARYNIDPERFGAWGPSAGGHLVALLGTAGDVAELETRRKDGEPSSRVQAVADFFGPTDFLQMDKAHGKLNHDRPNSPESELVGGAIQEVPEKVARANPITYIDGDEPPFLIVHGMADPAVPFHQSELLHEALQKAGLKTSLLGIDGMGHGWRGRPDIEMQAVWFFDTHLKGINRQETERGTYHWLTHLNAQPEGVRAAMFKPSSIESHTNYTIYLPDSYGEEGRRFPTVYYLHGRNGSPNGAHPYMERAREAMRKGLCPEMVIVAANGLPISMYCDSKDGAWPVESVIVKDLIPHIEATYDVIPERAARAIDGFSMGGHGAARLALKYPELFGTVSIMGAAMHRPEFLRDARPDIFEKTFGNDLAYCTAENPWTLLRANGEKLKGRTRIRVHVGENDERLRQKNVEFHELMDSLGIDHAFGVVPGAGHNERRVLDGLDDLWGIFVDSFARVEGVGQK